MFLRIDILPRCTTVWPYQRCHCQDNRFQSSYQFYVFQPFTNAYFKWMTNLTDWQKHKRKYTEIYCRFQITFHCNIPNFVPKFGNSLRSSKVHFRIPKPVCKLSIWLASLSSGANQSLCLQTGLRILKWTFELRNEVRNVTVKSYLKSTINHWKKFNNTCPFWNNHWFIAIIIRYTCKNLTTCNTNKLSTRCVCKACFKSSASLEQDVNNL